MGVFLGSLSLAGAGSGGGGGVMINQITEFYVHPGATPGYDATTGIYQHPEGGTFIETGKTFIGETAASNYPNAAVRSGKGYVGNDVFPQLQADASFYKGFIGNYDVDAGENGTAYYNSALYASGYANNLTHAYGYVPFASSDGTTFSNPSTVGDFWQFNGQNTNLRGITRISHGQTEIADYVNLSNSAFDQPITFMRSDTTNMAASISDGRLAKGFAYNKDDDMILLLAGKRGDQTNFRSSITGQTNATYTPNSQGIPILNFNVLYEKPDFSDFFVSNPSNRVNGTIEKLSSYANILSDANDVNAERLADSGLTNKLGLYSKQLFPIAFNGSDLWIPEPNAQMGAVQQQGPYVAQYQAYSIQYDYNVDEPYTYPDTEQSFSQTMRHIVPQVENENTGNLYYGNITTDSGFEIWGQNVTLIKHGMFAINEEGAADTELAYNEVPQFVADQAAGWTQAIVQFSTNTNAQQFVDLISDDGSTTKEAIYTRQKPFTTNAQDILGLQRKNLYTDDYGATYILPAGSNISISDANVTLGTTTDGFEPVDALGGDNVSDNAKNSASYPIAVEQEDEIRFWTASTLETWRIKSYPVTGTDTDSFAVGSPSTLYLEFPSEEQVRNNVDWVVRRTSDNQLQAQSFFACRDGYDTITDIAISDHKQRLYVSTGFAVYIYDISTGGTQDNPFQCIRADHYGSGSKQSGFSTLPTLRASDANIDIARMITGISEPSFDPNDVDTDLYGEDYSITCNNANTARGTTFYAIQDSTIVGIPNKLISSRGLNQLSTTYYQNSSRWDNAPTNFARWAVLDQDTMFDSEGGADPNSFPTTAPNSTSDYLDYRVVNDEGFENGNYEPIILPLANATEVDGTNFGRLTTFLRIA